MESWDGGRLGEKGEAELGLGVPRWGVAFGAGGVFEGVVGW